jgi:hypothetical protein
MTLPVHFVVALRYVLHFTTPLYLCLSASNVARVGDDGSGVTSVNTVLQQCTGTVVRLNIHFEITYSTTVVEFDATMALVVMMERSNFVSVGTGTRDHRSNGTLHFTDITKGFALVLLKRASSSG